MQSSKALKYIIAVICTVIGCTIVAVSRDDASKLMGKIAVGTGSFLFISARRERNETFSNLPFRRNETAVSTSRSALYYIVKNTFQFMLVVAAAFACVMMYRTFIQP